jgi:hypothetical protein
MFGGLIALATAEISSVVKRNLTVAALFLAAGLLVLFAAGYALAALHAHLALLYGPVFASLTIAGGLFLLALVMLGIALYIRRSPRPGPSPTTAAFAAAPVAAQFMRSGKMPWKAGIVAGVVVLGILLGRRLGRGDE